MSLRRQQQTLEQLSVLIPASERVNALEFGMAQPEYVPAEWVGFHVGVRLVEAFKTLSLLPATFGPALMHNSWPTYSIEWADLMAWESIQDEESKRQRAAGMNRVRLQPSHSDVSRMETALIWPGHYLATRPFVLRVVQKVALMRSRGLDIAQAARRLKKRAYSVRRMNRDGLDEIALGLRRDRVPVF